MKIFNKIKEFLRTETKYEYFTTNICYREVYEQSDRGGVRIVALFKKHVTSFGKTETLTEKVVFDNYHTNERDRNGNNLFTYSSPREIFGRTVFVTEKCENYKFAPINSRQLNFWVDEWEKTVDSVACPYCKYKHTIKKTEKMTNCNLCAKDFFNPYHPDVIKTAKTEQQKKS